MSVEKVVRWIAYCDVRGEPSPEERDSEEQAERDATDCPCRAEETRDEP